MELHPHAIGEKVKICVEHFASKVQGEIGGKAKAMIVTRTLLVCLETVKTLPVLFLLMRGLGLAIGYAYSRAWGHPIRVNSAPASRRTGIQCPILYPFKMRRELTLEFYRNSSAMGDERNALRPRLRAT